MMIVEIVYRGLPQQCALYDTWDVAPEDILTPQEVYSESVGKYALYTDGSRMLARVIHKRGHFFNTSSGLFHKLDYVSVCRPKVKMSGYSGLLFHHEHIKLRRPTEKERQLAHDFINNKYPKNHKLPKRCILIVLKDLQERMKSTFINAEWIIDKLKEEAENPKNRGADRIEAIKILCRVGGVEVGGLNTIQNKPTPLFAQYNNFTIQDQRRAATQQVEVQLPSQSALASALSLVPEHDFEELPEAGPL